MKDLSLATSVPICVVLYLLVRFGAENLQHWLLPGGDMTAWVVLLTPVPTLVSLLPSSLAGWLSRRALIAGFVVGFLGSATYSFLLGSAASYFQGSLSMLMGSLFIAQCVTGGLVGAAAGGAARLVRSNYSFKPTSLRDAA